MRYMIRQDRDHYIIVDENGSFICSCDTYSEAINDKNILEGNKKSHIHKIDE